MPTTPYMSWLGIVFDRYDPDDVVIRLPFREDLTNDGVVYHGGVIAAVMDTAGAAAAWSNHDFDKERGPRPSGMTIQYVGACKKSDLVCTGRTVQARPRADLHRDHRRRCRGQRRRPRRADVPNRVSVSSARAMVLEEPRRLVEHRLPIPRSATTTDCSGSRRAACAAPTTSSSPARCRQARVRARTRVDRCDRSGRGSGRRAVGREGR